MSKLEQVVSPNISVRATPGWCLAYVDDAVNAPVRRGSASLEYLAQKAAGNIHEEEPPVGLWVPVFFDITNGQYAQYDHVAWAYNHGDGRIEIHDSDVHSGIRGAYNSIAEICQWFGNAGLRYLGWSERVGGVQIVEMSKDDNTRIVSADNGVNVRYEPTIQAGVFATYPQGSEIEMAGWVFGENVNGSDRWFKSQRSGVYLHFSAFDEKEGSLPNLGDMRNNIQQPAPKATIPQNKAPEFVEFEKEFDFVDEVIPAHVSNQFYGRKNLKDDNGKYFGNIPEDYEIQKKFVDELQRDSQPIREITIHNTANNSIEATTNEFRRKESFKSAHLVVSNDKIVQVVPKTNTAFTNGNHESNIESFTIEFLDNVNDERYVEVLKKVVGALGIDKIGKHRDHFATACPAQVPDERFNKILDKVFDRAVEKPVENHIPDVKKMVEEKPTDNQGLATQEKEQNDMSQNIINEQELKTMEETRQKMNDNANNAADVVENLADSELAEEITQKAPFWLKVLIFTVCDFAIIISIVSLEISTIADGAKGVVLAMAWQNLLFKVGTGILTAFGYYRKNKK